MTINNVLIDSDIILDVLLARQPFCDDSIKFLNFCENRKITGFLTDVAIANIFYLLRKNHSAKDILKEIKHLLSFLDVLVIDKKVVLAAINSEFSDFEDALQNFSAIGHQNVDYIVTRNVKDYKKSKLNVLTPSQFLQIF